MDFQLTTEQTLLKDRARAFARRMIAPKAADYDREARFPWELLRVAQQQGLLHLTIPPAYGGMGSGVFEQALVVEELAWACTGIAAAINLNSLAISALLLAGTPAQKRRYLPRLLAGELCSFALTEPEAGSDPGAIQTTALHTEHGAGESYLLNGRKTWISNASEATLLIIFAKTSPAEGANGISAFLIERSTPGVLIGPPLGKLGQRATPIAEIVLQDVQVPRDALLGSQDYGFGLAMQVFDRSRPLVAAYGVGLTQRCLDEALAHARTRKTMGKPIIEHQAIGTKIAEMGMRLEAARLLTYQACWLLDAGQSATLQVAYAKAFAADTAMWAASEAVQIFGGAGYGTDLPLEKLFRDAKALQIYEGTSEIQRLIMASELAHTPLSYTIRPEPAPVQQDANTTDTSMAFARILPDDESIRTPLIQATVTIPVPQEVITTDAPHPPVHELFEAQVERTPDRVALTCMDEQLTYAALNQRANQLAPRLQELGVGPDVLVGICMERSIELITALLGVLKAGGAYVFLDPTYPAERLLFMQQDAQVKLLLTQQRLLARVPHQQVPIFCLDTDWETLEQESSDYTKSREMQHHLAYLIYTSGSTGLPKAVMIEQVGLSNMVEEQIRLFGIGSEHRIAHFAPFNFDASISELFLALLSGAPLFLLSQEQRWPIAPLLHSLREYAITTITLPPSVLSLLPPEQLPALQTIISAGEDLSREVATRWLSGRNVFNAYGPSEITVCATLGRCQQDMSHPSIGFPLAHTRIYLLDALLQPVKRGETGEIFIGGIGVARGYLGRPDLTAERFLPDPFSKGTGQQRLYRTGDLARYLPDGSLEYLGRVDHQVKIHGQRIELGEIEAALARHPAILECVVLGREVGDDDKRLLAYIVSQQPAAPSSKDLRAFLQQTLPDYMLPAAFLIVDRLPLMPNGKLDRQALLAQPFPSLEEARALRTSIEKELAEILAKFLGSDVSQIGRNSRFLELGSDSLLLTRLLVRIQEAFQVTLVPRSVYDFPTIATLAQHIENCQQGGGQRADTPILPIVRNGPLSLSFSQQRLWFLDQLNPGSTSYGIYGVFQFQGRLRIPLLEQSLHEIVRRHETLRTTIQVQEGQPVLSIAPDLATTLQLTSLEHLSAEEQELAVQHHIQQEVQQPFDLTRGPLARFTLFCLQEERHVFMVSIHHIIADGWSMDILYHELTVLYDAFGRGELSPLPDLSVQFVDFVAWQRQWAQSALLEHELAYWQQKLNGVPALLALPTDRPRPAIQTDHGAHYPFLFPLTLLQQLKKLSQQEHTTLFMTLLAAFYVLLYRYTGQQDLMVGTPIASRTSKAIEPLIGFFANTLALRTALSGSLGFRELLARVREVTLEAYTHQDMRFEQLVDALQLERNTSYSPLVQVMFALQRQQMFTLELSGLTVSLLPYESGTAKFDLTLEMVETDAGLRGSLEYNTDLFVRETIERMIGHLQQLLTGIVANPDQIVGELELLTERERYQAVQEWNRTEVAYPHKQSITALFEAQVERTPGAIALVWEQERLTYAELNLQANQVAWYLRKLGVGPEVRVGLCMQHTPEMITSVLGILKAGGAYVPLDPAYPQGRLRYMLESSQVAVVLLQDRFREKFGACKAQIVAIDTEAQSIAQKCPENPVHEVAHDHLMYVIYTSGSTGRPKGAGVNHHSFINLLHWYVTEFSITNRDRFAVVSSISFDLTQKNLFAPLVTGGTLVLCRREHYDPAAIGQSIAAEQATIINCTPGAFYPLVEHASESLSRHLSTLRYVFLGGEPIQMPRLRHWINSASCHAEIVNTYGPTECTDVCSFYRLGPAGQLAEASPPIGKPIFNTRLLIVNEYLQLMPVGVAGELCIGGDGVGRGYIEDSELTARKFIPDPFSDQPGARLYRTGDLARYLPDGTIEYLGRIDHQIKLRGFRIELGEVETALLEHPAVQESVVDLRTNQAGDQRLIAYIVPDLNYQPVETLANELGNEYIAQWQMLYEQTYRTVSALPDPTFNIIGWNSSYTGQPLAPEEMREQIDQTVERILALHPTSVYEIGCGTGLLLFRIAPFCSSYRGSDFSSEALRYVERFLPDLQLSQVTLDQRLAHDVSGIAEESFDVIILNSIIQYFPDIDYLLQTLTAALKMLKPGGSIFIGDIRSYPLLQAYAASVEFFQAAPSSTKEELRQRVHKRIYGEEELLIDPQLFMDLREHLPQIASVRIQLRRGHTHNELTRFRYDVILTRGMAQEEQRNLEVVYWHQRTHTAHLLERLLQETDADVVQLKHVPNARLMTEARILSWLSSEDGPATVGALKEALKESDESGVDPEDLWSLGSRSGYTTSVNWSETGSVTDCDVLFERTPLPISIVPGLAPNWEHDRDYVELSWKSYANNPLQGKVARKIIPELRESLTEHLPEYMVPTTFVALEQLPLTPNGKVDRGALPDPDAARAEMNSASVAPRTPIEEVLASIWCELLDLKRVSIHENFFALGGNSLLAIQLMFRVNQQFQVDLPLQNVFEHPTLAELAEALLVHESVPGKLTRIAQLRQKILAMSESERQSLLSSKRKKAVK